MMAIRQPLLLLLLLSLLLPPPCRSLDPSFLLRRDAFLTKALTMPLLFSPQVPPPLQQDQPDTTTSPAAVGGGGGRENLAALLDAKQIYWTDGGTTMATTISTSSQQNHGGDNRPAVDWTKFRYGTSTLQGSQRLPAVLSTSSLPQPTQFPLRGYYLVTYKFRGASFPQGRSKISLRLAGAGLATCLALPNVGKSPSFAMVQRYSSSDDNKGGGGYEDWAYNYPRKLEAFWPQAKVQSVQTGGLVVRKDPSISRTTTSAATTAAASLTPKCFVDGSGCGATENPHLHDPATRLVLDFSGPTRNGPERLQTIDTTLLMTSSSSSSTTTSGDGNDDNDDNNDTFWAARTFTQLNVQQDLQTFYKEIIEIRRDTLQGRIRVAAFLPKVEAVTSSSSSSSTTTALDYDDTRALALYDYDIRLQPISPEDALQT